jgi:hypothetical protein
MTEQHESQRTAELTDRQQADTAYLGSLSVDALVDIHRSIATARLDDLLSYVETAIDRTLVDRPQVLLAYVGRLTAEEDPSVRLVGYGYVNELAAVDLDAARSLWVQWLDEKDPDLAAEGHERLHETLNNFEGTHTLPMADIAFLLPKLVESKQRNAQQH